MLPMNKNVLESISNTFTPKLRKRLLTGVLVVAVMGGVGVGSAHYYKTQQRDKAMVARAEMIRAEAKNNNIALLDDNQIRSIVANTMGVNEDRVTFKRITLTATNDKKDRKDNHNDDRFKDRNEHKDGKQDHKSEPRKEIPSNPFRQDGNTPPHNINAQLPGNNETQPASIPATPAQGAPIPPNQLAPQEQPNPMMQAGNPENMLPPIAKRINAVYKVAATANGVDYRFVIDPVSGRVINSDVRG